IYGLFGSLKNIRSIAKVQYYWELVLHLCLTKYSLTLNSLKFSFMCPIYLKKSKTLRGKMKFVSGAPLSDIVFFSLNAIFFPQPKHEFFFRQKEFLRVLYYT